jgi:hypothetical protein
MRVLVELLQATYRGRAAILSVVRKSEIFVIPEIEDFRRQ